MKLYVKMIQQMPIDGNGEPRKHFIAPAWYVNTTPNETDTSINMHVVWEDVEIPGGFLLSMPIFVNKRSIKRGELLKRFWDGKTSLQPPIKKARKVH